MIPAITDFIIKIAPGIIIAFFAAKWAVRKFYTEKWWERKEKAYTEIIEALYDLVQYFSVHKEDYGQGIGYSKDKEIELYQKYEKSYWTLKKATDIGSFYISNKAESVLAELSIREHLDFHNNPKFEVYEQEFIYHKDALDKIIKIAKMELGASKT